VVELLFMMVILKLPILYLGGVCYWAIKAEPKPLEGAGVAVRTGPNPDRPIGRRRGPDGPRSHGGPTRREARRQLGRPARSAR
jgi:hypothetical protein